MGRILATLLLTLGLTAPAARANLLLFDIDADPGAWASAVTDLTAEIAYDFTVEPDFGVTGFSAPLTSTGSGPVTPETVAGGVTITATPEAGSGPVNDLVGVGPLAGFGNLQNAVLGNAFEDSYTISFSDPVIAAALNIVSILGSGLADLAVGDALFEDVVIGGSAGRNIGILGTGDMTIGSINIFDHQVGAEGLQGVGTIYRNRQVAVSSPATLALLGLGLLGILGRSGKRAS